MEEGEKGNEVKTQGMKNLQYDLVAKGSMQCFPHVSLEFLSMPGLYSQVVTDLIKCF